MKSIKYNNNHWGYAHRIEGISPAIIDGYKFKDRVSVLVYETEDTAGHEEGLHRGRGDGSI